jgi:endonuclease/exonuclease/phosphatase family metal-dependent hydrolase
MGRKLLLLELNFTDTTMAIGTVHLESMDNTARRCQQLLYILDECLRDYDHAMVMGDFNFHEVSPENEECLATHPDYVDIWPYLRNGEDGHTVTETRTRFSGFRIDRILLRSDYFFAQSIERIGKEPILHDTVVNEQGVSETEPIFPSDHYGLSALIAPLQLDDD